MQRFHVKGKLAPRYIGPFKILDYRGAMSYKLELPPKMSEVHDVFHVSQLHKCLQPPNKPEVFKEIDHNSIDLSHYLTIERYLFVFSKKTSVLPEGTRSKCTRFNGATTLKMKLHGNTRIISRKNFQAYLALNY
jgi:hypothetical protein